MSAEDEDFAAMLDASFQQEGMRNRRLRPGQVIEGTVLQIGKEAVFVDVGTRSEATIDRWELTDKDGELKVAVGDKVRATVAVPGDRPKLVISFGKGGLDVSALEIAKDGGTPLEGEVAKVVKGGLEIQLSGVRAFCPASQIDRVYTADLSVFEGQTLKFLVTEVRDGGRSVVVSRRALLDQERELMASETMEKVTEGAVMEGTVTSTQTYGAFVDLGGVEGLIHVSELGTGRVDKVEDVVTVGEKVQVKIMGVEAVTTNKGEQRRIKLSMRALQANAGDGPSKVGGDEVLEGQVTKVEPFGVFVQTEKGAGMVPSRELDLPHGGDPRRAYPIGKTVRLVAIGADNQGKPRFSMKRVEDAEARAAYKNFRAESRKQSRKKKGDVGSLGALLMAKIGGADVPDGPASSDGGEKPKPPGKRTRVR